MHHVATISYYELATIHVKSKSAIDSSTVSTPIHCTKYYKEGDVRRELLGLKKQQMRFPSSKYDTAESFVRSPVFGSQRMDYCSIVQ